MCGAGFGVGVACAVVGAAFVLGRLISCEGSVAGGSRLIMGVFAGGESGLGGGECGGGGGVLLLEVGVFFCVGLPVVQALAQDFQDGGGGVRGCRCGGGVGGELLG